MLSKIFENNLNEPIILQLYSLTAKSSKMRLVPDDVHKMVLSYKDRLPETNLCESKKSNMLWKKRCCFPIIVEFILIQRYRYIMRRCYIFCISKKPIVISSFRSVLKRNSHYYFEKSSPIVETFDTRLKGSLLKVIHYSVY